MIVFYFYVALGDIPLPRRGRRVSRCRTLAGCCASGQPETQRSVMSDERQFPETPVVPGPPDAQGLYDPRDEHDACGVGFVVDIKGRKSNGIVRQALQVLMNLAHRGACGCETN